MIRSTARQQWRLLAVNLGSSVLEALSEGATLAVVFLAVLLQALQSLGRFANNVSVGYFAAECRARVTAPIHNPVEQSGQLCWFCCFWARLPATALNPAWLPPEPPGAARGAVLT